MKQHPMKKQKLVRLASVVRALRRDATKIERRGWYGDGRKTVEGERYVQGLRDAAVIAQRVGCKP